MKLYIAGPMTGMEDWNFPAFFDAEKQLESLGYAVENPARHDGNTVEEALATVGTADNPVEKWEFYVKRDLKYLLECVGVVLLPGWQDSKGARLEVHIAKQLKMPLFILKDEKLAPRITCIGLAGYAQSGKDTVAKTLTEDFGYKKVAFADSIREALLALNPRIEVAGMPMKLAQAVKSFGWDFLKKEDTGVRELLQKFGTEVGRELIDENIWVNMALDSIPDGSRVVFSDVRYPNEADAIKSAGGSVWRVNRPDNFGANEHESEHALQDYKFNIQINNVDTVDFLEDIVVTLMKENRHLWKI
jgi:hypothetical protein